MKLRHIYIPLLLSVFAFVFTACKDDEEVDPVKSITFSVTSADSLIIELEWDSNSTDTDLDALILVGELNNTYSYENNPPEDIIAAFSGDSVGFEKTVLFSDYDDATYHFYILPYEVATGVTTITWTAIVKNAAGEEIGTLSGKIPAKSAGKTSNFKAEMNIVKDGDDYTFTEIL